MEQKVEVEKDGRVMRIPKHMLEDALRLGCTQTKKPIKNPPKELLLPRNPTVKIEANAEVKSEIELVKEQLDKAGIKYHPATGLAKLKAKLK